MKTLDRYALILSQAIAELERKDAAQNEDERIRQQVELAPKLGDVLYRLCVEHGVSFTPFRETVIDLVSDEEAAAELDGSLPFAHGLEEDHGLILLALETMPPDPMF